MNGEWDVNPRIRPGQGAPVEAAYRLSTSTRGLSLAQGAEPAGSEGRYEEGMPGMSRGPAASGTAPPGGEPGITGTILIDAARRQEIGVKTARVEKRDLSAAIRAVGRVSYDEKRQAEMAPKFSGWIRELHVDYMGQPVRAGDVLAAVYSPELWSAQQEYIEALRNGPADSARAVEPGTDLAWAARRRLLLWDIAPAVIEQIAREGKPRETIPIVAPASGVVIEKSVVLGSAFTAGQVLYRIAPLDPAWVIASVYQVDLPLVRLGMPATLSDPYLDERSRTGRISFIHPALEAETRTAKVRIEIPNPRGDLKPGAFVNVELETRLGKGLAVPASAVLPTGERRIVFVDLGDGRLAPRDVRLGVRAGDYYQVLDGLVEGDVVVTSGNFLVAAESKLRSAAGKW
jgi:Cu(I)/Ag(I) efflux system membrane fusion protein